MKSTTMLSHNQNFDIRPEVDPYVLPFTAIDAKDLPRVGGKGANLGEMTQAGFLVPAGFCVTTTAFQQFMAGCVDAADLYMVLAAVNADELEGVRRVGEHVRSTLTQTPIPDDVVEAILVAWREQGTDQSYAVRSSATAEDLPNASFAGQQDTYLNVQGADDLLESVRQCWISLFTDRAIIYRVQNNFDHREVLLSVVVQRMVLPEVSGILFTADPVSGHRHIATIDASYGLGEALVSGLVSADLYKVDKRTLHEIEANIADKQIAIRPLSDGGTTQEQLNEPERSARVLSSPQVKALAEIGTRIETHYGQPQDIEWALAKDKIYIVQSRPITSLYPLPDPAPTDDERHIYLSFSHAQVMTDPMPPLALSIWQQTFPFGRDMNLLTDYNPYMITAGGRLYIDVTAMLHHKISRQLVLTFLENVDPFIVQTLREITARLDFQQMAARSQNKATMRGLLHWMAPIGRDILTNLIWHRLEGRTEEMNQWSEQFIAKVQSQLDTAAPGAERLQVANTILGAGMGDIIRRVLPLIAAGLLSRALLLRLLPNQAEDIALLMRGLAGNVTTDMDLHVGDLVDIARRFPALVAHLDDPDPVAVFESIRTVKGGTDFLSAWEQFLEQYGMRGPSEIDISRPRWRDDPSSLIQVIASNLQQTEAGSHRQQHQRMMVEGEEAGERLIVAAQTGLLGGLHSRMVRRLIRIIRNLLAVREHPKFLLVRIFSLIREAILDVGTQLQAQNRIDAVDEVWYFDLHELIRVLERPADDLRPRIAKRKADMARYWTLRPPRVMLSDGENPIIKHQQDNLPVGVLPGSPVSVGTVEGLARVVIDPTRDALAPGEILVAPFTDPGWTPLFINAAGLVMEVGGLMTHGSVVAREYGIPAVVGVLDATQRIQTGQRIRVDGDQGYVEILDKGGEA